MGIITGKWLLPSSSHLGAEGITPRWVAERLREATGLYAEARADGVVCIPALREKLFDWVIEDGAVSVDGYAPAHPYLWENLDAVMTEAGCTRTEDPWRWQPDPTRTGLRKQWKALPPRNRLILSQPLIRFHRLVDAWLKPTRGN